MSVTQEIREKLLIAFGDGNFEIVDDSEAHRGHSGYQEGGESHFNLTVFSSKFTGLSRIQRHRAVHDALGKNLIARIHALALKLDVPAGQD